MSKNKIKDILTSKVIKSIADLIPEKDKNRLAKINREAEDEFNEEKWNNYAKRIYTILDSFKKESDADSERYLNKIYITSKLYFTKKLF